MTGPLQKDHARGGGENCGEVEKCNHMEGKKSVLSSHTGCMTTVSASEQTLIHY